MIRKTRLAALAALASITSITIANAEGSGVNAQPGENPQISEPVLTAEVVPVFVEKEVVQPLPEKSEQPTVDAASLAQLVAAMPDRDTLSHEMECLAGAVYFESRGEPLAGQLAVAQVVINRAESGQYPSNWCAVVKQKAQFSFVRDGRFPSIATGSEAWRKAKAIAVIAANNMADAVPSDVLWYHADYVSPSWGKRLSKVEKIGAHIFYRA